MANVFNTFSFNKWADSKKEEELDKESKARRTEQIKRLKERLRKERELRENGMGNGDLDLEALIEALQRGQEINAVPVDEEPREHHPTSYGAMDDNDILEEIRIFQQNQYFNPTPVTSAEPELQPWMYNRRINDLDNENPTKNNGNGWMYNRRINDLHNKKQNKNDKNNDSAPPVERPTTVTKPHFQDASRAAFIYNRIVSKEPK
ncbi:unnamed protein product [Cylicocyclus nassatus]|uniref:Uncharacterized protein n=1 Tax=Cylicocyclus nassatus TaxID=53992 RepID=A0AA36M4B0_CYLNA|nr:unnamed protein product [Cylicocyclus nassatus]